MELLICTSVARVGTGFSVGTALSNRMPECRDRAKLSASRILRWAPRILRDDPGSGRFKTLACYLGLEFGSVFGPPTPGRARKTRILGAEMEFFDYRPLLYTFVEIFLRRDYLFLTDRVRPFIVDCGANIGMSILFFKRTYPGSRILAFEPDPETFTLLKRNVEASGFEGVTLVNKAVLDSEGVTNFHSAPYGPGSALMSVVGTRASMETVTVPSVKLSDYLEEPVDFLKIDVEGAEGKVIRQLAESGKIEHVQQMAIEYHHHLHPEENELAGLLDVLERGGFGYQIRGDVKTPVTPGRFEDLMIYTYKK